MISMTESFKITLCVLAALLLPARAQEIETSVEVDTSSIINRIRDDFVCFTMDWWPPEKCDYGRYSWDNASILNMDLDNELFGNAVSEFSPVHLRIGGSLQDGIVYDIGDPPVCEPITEADNRVGFEGGCLNMTRWTQVNDFCNRVGCQIIFGLNQLIGREQIGETDWTGEWDETNTVDFLRYTAQQLGEDSTVAGWQLGNEIVGETGVYAHLTAEEVAPDFLLLRQMINNFWPDDSERPLLIGPDANAAEIPFFEEFLPLVGDELNVMSWHTYSLGAGVNPDVPDLIMDPDYLDRLQNPASDAQSLRDTFSPNLELWLSEGGGAYNSGQFLTTNAFMSGFWWLDQIGTMSRFGHQSYCRQSLIGGNYGLLNTTTMEPNPDYYSTLLWRRLMGEGVLDTKVDPATPSLRAYTHCMKTEVATGCDPSEWERDIDFFGADLLTINNIPSPDLCCAVCQQTSDCISWTFIFDPSDVLFQDCYLKNEYRPNPTPDRPNRAVSGSVGSPGLTMVLLNLHEEDSFLVRIPSADSAQVREEFLFTSDDLHSQSMILNGSPLHTEDNQIPALNPRLVNNQIPVVLPPHSYMFAVWPEVVTPACYSQSVKN